ncbi:MAG: hypothetical protein EAZ97_10030 [Bacteroidetes bacterium]|nr:MAG: hypothetical protein EAZ97_10030 [Bacteroidota bacterium]
MFTPFMLIRDVFPFFRFGMFAEAIKRNSQKEVFRISFFDGTNFENFEPNKIEMTNSVFQGICKNYHYRGQNKVLLQKFDQIAGDSTKNHWKFFKIIEKDTFLLEEWKK